MKILNKAKVSIADSRRPPLPPITPGSSSVLKGMKAATLIPYLLSMVTF